MALTPVSGILQVPLVPASGAVTPAQPGAPFAALMRNAVQQMQTLDRNAAQAVDGLMTGSGTDIHTAMIATQKADLAFEMALSFRNKAVGAYQQLMSTQF
ncbi:MAG: flagellar hook-basal body complex subunit FliE [Acidobacteriaceae bacterium]|jgi:flagellar hook-basal body complex protein FliE|nr:flagellar hook-basal body complex subunit FliE [Acidobacteriaceae bacterium]